MNIPSQQLIDEVQDLINGGKLEVADTLGISILIDFAKEARQELICEHCGSQLEVSETICEKCCGIKDE